MQSVAADHPFNKYALAISSLYRLENTVYYMLQTDSIGYTATIHTFGIIAYDFLKIKWFFKIFRHISNVFLYEDDTTA